MKPYDNALPQEREWEKEADTYGYVVCAPELRTSDSFMEYPLTKEHDYVLEDRRNVLAIMDHVFATTRADPRRVLSTSWSCGGYLAHYFPNRYPERFSCIATRLSNFSAQLMIEETVPRYRKLPVAIYIGDGDFPACKTESEEAVAWYEAREFDVEGRMIDNMGHRRIPQTAAAFFAKKLGIKPIHPQDAQQTLNQVQMTAYSPPDDLRNRLRPPTAASSLAMRPPDAGLDRSRSHPTTPPYPPPTLQQPSRGPYVNTNAGRNYRGTPSYESPRRSAMPPANAVASTVPPTGAAAARKDPVPRASGNWLSPVQDGRGPVQAGEFSRATGTPGPRRAASVPPPPYPRAQSPARLADARTSSPDRRNPAYVAPTSRVDSSRSPVSVRRPAATHSPSDVGRRDYDTRKAARWAGNPEVQGNPAGKAGRPEEMAVLPGRSSAPRDRQVNIRLAGPAIGTSPHYVQYSVELPRGITDGADFLWTDNGDWMSDEPYGSKVLDSPGLHRICVLIVTRDNISYRGQATVHVLEQGSALSSFAPRPG
jgi:hypothetical protein